MKIKKIIFLVFMSGFYVTCNSQQKAKGTIAAGGDSNYTYRKASPDGIGKFYFGREISHVMSPEGSVWLERDDRNQEENTNLAIDKIPVTASSVIADIGAGTGYYSFRLSSKMPRGKIYAVEIQDELIDYLRNKKASLNDSIVEIIKSTNLSPNLPENSIDLAIMVDVYHELEYPQEMLQSIRKALKPWGKLLLIEYRAEDPSVHIKALHKTSVAQLNKELGANGFQLNYKGDFLPIQHFLLYEKKKG
jgi:SAM-dependent methyltransferase